MSKTIVSFAFIAAMAFGSAALGQSYRDIQRDDALFEQAKSGDLEAMRIIGHKLFYSIVGEANGKRLYDGNPLLFLGENYTFRHGEKMLYALQFLEASAADGDPEAERAIAILLERRNKEDERRAAREAADQAAETARQQAAQQRENQLRLNPPSQLNQQIVQAAIDQYVYTGMRYWARANFGTYDIVYWDRGATVIANASMRYEISTFDGCQQSSRSATCSFTVRMRFQDTFNYGTSAFHNSFKGLMERLAASQQLRGSSSLRWDGEKWKVVTDPRRLFQ